MIEFMRWRKLYFLISAVVIVPGLISLLFNGLRVGIDFTGGTEWQFQIVEQQDQPFTAEAVSAQLGEEIEVLELSQEGEVFLLRARPITIEQKTEITSRLNETFGTLQEQRFELVGPTLGRELVIKTLTALLLSAGGITLYVAYRFRELKYGISAVVAMLHDSLVVVGIFSILGWLLGVEVDALFVTALLTILSFSVHDTIVVFDRIRELRSKHQSMHFTTLVNQAVTETLSRSINNSMTIILMLLALWLLGGESVKWFVFALLVGTVTGTYSSTFTAAPLLLVWDEIAESRRTK